MDFIIANIFPIILTFISAYTLFNSLFSLISENSLRKLEIKIDERLDKQEFNIHEIEKLVSNLETKINYLERE